MTLRSAVEEPATIERGTDVLVPVRSRDRIVAVASIAAGKRGRILEKWDGHTAERIGKELSAWWSRRSGAEYAAG